jgi:RNA 2',3'-cyclic 3'-phosphodiesterase
MRLFVAVDLPDETKRVIAAEQKRIAAPVITSGGSLKLVAPAQMHLTLLFLGEVQEARVPAVTEAMNTAVDVPAFDLALGGVGVFPPRGAPRVLWMGVTMGAAPLTSLQRAIAERIRRLDIAFDDRPFHPHLTLGRWRESRGSGRGTVRSAAEVAEITRLRVTCATLYQSRLASSGPAYTALAHANLSG